LRNQPGSANRFRCRAGLDYALVQASFVVDRCRYGLVQVSVGDDGLPLPRKPKVVDPDGGNEPLYETLRTDTVEPLVLSVPFQIWVMV